MEQAAWRLQPTYQDGTQDPTLIFNLGDYTVNFFAK